MVGQVKLVIGQEASETAVTDNSTGIPVLKAEGVDGERDGNRGGGATNALGEIRELRVKSNRQHQGGPISIRATVCNTEGPQYREKTWWKVCFDEIDSEKWLRRRSELDDFWTTCGDDQVGVCLNRDQLGFGPLEGTIRLAQRGFGLVCLGDR
ncbi:hypothetical protein Q7P36_010878 [Cladosporium allicinum]